MAQHTLGIKDELYKKLTEMAVKETVKRKKPLTWSKLAVEILTAHTQQNEKPQPSVPEKRC